jgi:hypothetical protein
VKLLILTALLLAPLVALHAAEARPSTRPEVLVTEPKRK